MGTIGNGDTVTKTKEIGEGHDWTLRPRGQPQREETAAKKPGEGRGASSTAPMAMRAMVNSSRAAP